jgi:hypothetical protein
MTQNFPANSNVSYLACNSQDDPNVINPNFNPADFVITVPNSSRLQEVVRISITSCSVPRMFENVDQINNMLFFWQRQVIELDYSSVMGPGWVLRTVNPIWIPVNSIILPRGIQNMDALLATLNAISPYTWSYTPAGPPLDMAGGSVQIVTHSPFTTYVFGPFYDPGWVPPTGPPVYANMTMVTSFTNYADTPLSTRFPGLGAMGLLGLRPFAEDAKVTEQINSQLFNSLDSSTFGSVNGLFTPGDIQIPLFPAGEPYPNPIYKAARLPLFDQLATYSTWSTASYTTPRLIAPDLSGPSTVYVTITDLGDGTTTYARTGTNYDVITAVNLSQTPWGENAFKEVKDGEFEGIGLRNPRNITMLRVRILGAQFQALKLPPNFEVDLRCQLVFITR